MKHVLVLCVAALMPASLATAQTAPPAPVQPDATSATPSTDATATDMQDTSKPGKHRHARKPKPTSTASDDPSSSVNGGGMIDSNGMPTSGSGIPAATTGGNGAPPR